MTNNMIDNRKNLNIDLRVPKNVKKNIAPVRSFLISIFCPRCGQFNIQRHRIFKRRYFCYD